MEDNMGMKTIWIALLCFFFSITLKGQNYSSISAGVWTNPVNWNNTSGWGTNTPPINGTHGSGTITLQHDMSIATNYTLGSATLNVISGSTLSVIGNMGTGGGGTINVYGTLYIVGDLTLNKTLNVHPGGKVIVEGSVTVNSAEYLRIGTNVASPPYADLIINENLIQQGSGDVTINQNGRLGVFGNVTDSGGGGTFIRVNNGGQAYVHGNITYSGGSSTIQNNNTTSPFGLYVNGTATSTGGGGSITTNLGDQATMVLTNPEFFQWVAEQTGSPLPVTLLFFKVESISQTEVNLVWATASESNFDYFALERSRDGFSFSEVARINGNGNTSDRKDYFFRDNNPLKGMSYYRLKSVDFDGQTETFQMISVIFNGGKRMSVHPNPVTDGTLKVEFNFLPEKETTVSIYDLNGVEVDRKTEMSVFNVWDIDLVAGIYLVKISSEGLEKTSKLVVR
jgi:hypothetical protein